MNPWHIRVDNFLSSLTALQVDVAMEVKKVGIGKSSRAYLTADKSTHPVQASIILNEWKAKQTCWPLRSTTIFLALHLFPLPSLHLLAFLPSIAIPIQCFLKSAGFLLLLLMAFSQTRQCLRPYHYELTPNKGFPSWDVRYMADMANNAQRQGLP